MPGMKQVALTETRGDVELKAVSRRNVVRKLHICPYPRCGKRLFSYEAYKQHYAESHLAKVRT